MTTSIYATDHASALADISAAGAAVTFTRAKSTIYVAETDANYAVTPTSIPGFAVRVRGNPLKYQALSLIQSEAPALLFAPSTLGGLPLPGDTVTWGGEVYTVRDVDPESPDGVAIIATVIIAR